MMPVRENIPAGKNNAACIVIEYLNFYHYIY